MATGDSTNGTMLSNGRRWTADFEGLIASQLSGFEAGQSMSLSGTSEGYNSGALGTKARTGIACSFVSAADAGGSVIFNDTCTESSDTEITLHTPDTDTVGTGYATNGDGTVTVVASTDKIKTTVAGTGDTQWWFDAGQADGVYTATVATGSGTNRWWKLLVRRVDASNYWYVHIESRTNDSHRLYKVVSGSPTLVDTSVGEFDSSGTNEYTVTCDGNSIKVAAGGVTFLEADDAANNTGTEFGAATESNYIEPTFDDIGFDTLPTHARVTFESDEPFHDDCSSITANIPEGLLNDGTNSNTANASLSIDNSANTRDYPEVGCNIVGIINDSKVRVWREAIIGTFRVEADAGHYYARSGQQVDSVYFEITEAFQVSSASGAFTEGETITGGTSGVTAEVVYDVEAGELVVHSVSGTPTVGETFTGGSSGATCQFDAGGTFDTTTATSETRSTYNDNRYFSRINAVIGENPFTANSGGLGVFQSDEIDTTNYTSQRIYCRAVGRPHIGDADSVQADGWMIFNLDASTSLTLTDVYFDDANGDDGTGVGSSGNPYKTLRRAMDDADGATTSTRFRFLAKSAATYPIEADVVGTTDNTVMAIVAPDPSAGLSATDVVIRGDDADHRVRTLLIEDCKIDVSDGTATGNSTIRGNASHTDGVIHIRGCTVNHPSGRDTADFLGTNWINQYSVIGCVIDSQATDMARGAFGGWTLVRNCDILEVMDDFHKSCHAIFAVWGVDLGDPGGGAHLDGIQWTIDPNKATVSNVCLFDLGSGAQSMLCDLANTGTYIRNFIGVPAAEEASLVQFGKSTTDPAVANVIMQCATVPNQAFTWANSTAGNYTNCIIEHCVYEEITAGAGASSADGVPSQISQHNMVLNTASSADTDFGITVTDGDEDAFVDGIYDGGSYSAAALDFRPSSGSEIPTLVSGRARASFDAWGYSVPDDGTGAIGALQAAASGGGGPPSGGAMLGVGV